MTIKVKMIPSPADFGEAQNGMLRVVDAYNKYLPKYDIELVDGESYDLKAVHAGMSGQDCDVAHLHGLYWGGEINVWQRKANLNIIQAIRSAKQVTVPSSWVAETFERDLRYSPHIVPHAIDHDKWINDNDGNYVLWNKNRIGDVCSPYPMNILAARANSTLFLTTFSEKNPTQNIKSTGLVSHTEMITMVKECSVYLSTTKETFGIGVLEAMAASKPILGWNFGGNQDLVKHGVNGYLARPNDYDDLERGLNYCLKHGKVLGKNSRMLSLNYTWDTIAQQIAEIYQLAMVVKPPSVSVVIPVYNKPIEDIKRAVLSACSQTLKPLSVIVVNDGSTTTNKDDIISVVNEAKEKFGIKLKYIEQSNQGVAVARNTGIGSSKAKYICCLDSDDWIDEKFLEICVDALENDVTLGVAYTGLMTHIPNGTSKLSKWPTESDYDRQINYKARMNQIPTCCVFRRIVWERTGGYRQRYAPKGAGSEDAAFLSLFGSLGYGAIKVSNEGLFNYTAFEGNVSGNREYQEKDWLALYPWSRDGKHPFASIATPKKITHTVREYDEPVISIIIPVGPNHAQHVFNALDSIESQHFRKWEVIIVDDTGDDSLSKVLVPYPYAKRIKTEGSVGAGVARNLGVKKSRGDFIFFLDADDFINPSHPEAFNLMLEKYVATGHAVYSDYIGRAIISDPEKLATNLQRNILYTDPKTNEVFIKYDALEFDCNKAIAQPHGDNPSNFYIWNLVSTLIPKNWHNVIGGFDEEIKTWEDWDYWLRMVKAGYCFSRIQTPLLIYKFYTGHRRQWAFENSDSGQNWQGYQKIL